MVSRLWTCVALALLLAGARAVDASACGYTVRASAHGHHARRAPLVLGDSTMIFAAPWLGRRGLQADAKEWRQFSEGVGILAARRRAGTLPHLSILALGANGPVSSRMIAGALHTIGRGRVLGLVSPRKSAVTAGSMRRAARVHPDRVLLIDWVSYSAGHGGWFGGDGLHVTPAAGRIYASFIARRSAPLYAPPAKALHVPTSARAAKVCGTVRRSGKQLAVDVLRGRDRVTCRHARRLARKPPPAPIRGWTGYAWRATGHRPWLEVYARADRRAIVVTARAAANASAAPTRRRRYRPIDPDGTLRDGLK